jgi:hypothetical protein
MYERNVMKLPSVGVMRAKPLRPYVMEKIVVAKVRSGQAVLDMLWGRKRYRVMVTFDVEVTDLGGGAGAGGGQDEEN